MAIRKVAVSLADSIDLRIILSVLYIITEVMRAEKSADGEFRQQVDDFIVEISECEQYCMMLASRQLFRFVHADQPIGDELLTVKLLGMITRFCSGSAPHFPMKKVLLLLWKISLVGLGGMQSLRELKGACPFDNWSPARWLTRVFVVQCSRSRSQINTGRRTLSVRPRRTRWRLRAPCAPARRQRTMRTFWTVRCRNGIVRSGEYVRLNKLRKR